VDDLPGLEVRVELVGLRIDLELTGTASWSV
jgi:hypothetical protein